MKKKLNSMHTCVKLFLQGREDQPLLSVIDPDFILSLGRFLFSGAYGAAQKNQGKKGKFDSLAHRTLVGQLVMLRLVVRQAIKDGLIPAIDVFPQAAATLKQEFSISDADLIDILGNDQSRYSALPSHDFVAEVSRLSALAFPELTTKPRIKRALPMLMYMLSVYSYGMELAELLSIRHTCMGDAAVDESVTVRHPRLGFDVQLPERALRIVDLLNKGYAPDGYLIARRLTWLDADPAEIAQQLAAQIQSGMRALGVSLFSTGSIFSDWLCMAKDAKLPDAAVLALGRGECPEQWRQAVAQCGESVLAAQSIFKKNWHILCSYSPGLDSTQLRADVAEYLKEQGVRFDMQRESYDPQMIEKRQVRGKVVKKNSSAISRYLFIYCTPDEAKLIDRMSPKASFLRVIGERQRLARVGHKDVIDMVKFLRDFRADVQLIDISLPAENTVLAEGVKVRILSGPFAGFEGTIAQILKSNKFSSERKSLTDKTLMGGGNSLDDGQQSNSDSRKRGRKRKPTRTERFATPEDSQVFRVDVHGFAMSQRATTQLSGLDLAPLSSPPAP